MTKEQLYTEYAGFHRDARNRRLHTVGIPLILIGLFGVLALVRLGPVDLAVAAGAAVLIYYVFLDPLGAAVSAVAFSLLYLAATHLPWQAAAGAFAAGWILQLAGHRLEGNRPKFFENLVYLLIGPLYFFSELCGLRTSARSAV